MKKHILFCLLFLCTATWLSNAQQIKLSFSNNLNDSGINHYLVDTNACGNAYTFCDDASGNPLSAYQFNGQCGMQTDSFSMTNTAYNGFSVSFYMSSNFDADSIPYGIMHFYKGSFLLYAYHDSLFLAVTDSTYTDHTFGVPYPIPGNEWACVVVSFTDHGNVDFYFNKQKYTAAPATFGYLRKECVPGFCYPFHVSTDIWANEFFKGKLDEIQVWNWPSDSLNVEEICTKTIVPTAYHEWSQSDIKCYPNPAGDLLMIETRYAGQLRITDLFGKTLLLAKLDIGINPIITSILPNGIYLVSIKTADATYSRKIIVE